MCVNSFVRLIDFCVLVDTIFVSDKRFKIKHSRLFELGIRSKFEVEECEWLFVSIVHQLLAYIAKIYYTSTLPLTYPETSAIHVLEYMY